MQSNHPCKETRNTFRSTLLGPSLVLLTSSPINGGIRNRFAKKIILTVATIPYAIYLVSFILFLRAFSRTGILLLLALSRRFRSIKSASQFQPRVPMPLDLYRFQPITFCWGLRIAISGHVPIVTRELVFLTRGSLLLPNKKVRFPSPRVCAQLFVMDEEVVTSHFIRLIVVLNSTFISLKKEGKKKEQKEEKRNKNKERI